LLYCDLSQQTLTLVHTVDNNTSHLLSKLTHCVIGEEEQ